MPASARLVSPTALLGAGRCPSNGDLLNATALDEMLKARASPDTRELVILILGWTNGRTQVTMRDSGIDFVMATLNALVGRYGINNYMVLTPHLINSPNRAGWGNNVCLNTLRPRGICCGYSSIGMNEVVNNTWEIFPTHPYMLFLQRWWFTAQAVARGVSVLSLDSDLHLSLNPLRIFHQPPYDELDVIFQSDGNSPSVSQLFNSTVNTILSRLVNKPSRDKEGRIHQNRVWPQDVMNEQVFKTARMPRKVVAHGMVAAQGMAHSQHCHPYDYDCKVWGDGHPKKDASGLYMPRTCGVMRPPMLMVATLLLGSTAMELWT